MLKRVQHDGGRGIEGSGGIVTAGLPQTNVKLWVPKNIQYMML